MSDDVNSQPPTGAPEPPDHQGNGDAAPTPWTPSGNQPGMPQPPASWSQSGPGQDNSFAPPPMTPSSSWETPSGPVPQEGPTEVIHQAPTTDPFAPPSAGAPEPYSPLQGGYPGAATPGGYAPQGGPGAPGVPGAGNGPYDSGFAASYGAPDPFAGPQPGQPGLPAPQGSPYPGPVNPGSPQGPGINPYGGSAGYTPPGTPMGAAAKKNNAPIFLGLGVGVVAIIAIIALVVTFMLQSAGGAPGGTDGAGADPSSPKGTSGTPDPGEQSAGEDPDAAKGNNDQSGSATPKGQSGGGAVALPTGGYEPPATAWLHEGYGTGVDTWETNGELIGTSKDNAIVVFQQTGDSGRGIVGFDAKSGKEQWRNDFGSGFVTCAKAIAGIAYCTQRENQENTLIAMDLSTGKTATQLKLSDDQRMRDGIGAQLGRTYWILEKDGEEALTLVAAKDGAIAWEAPLEKNTLCVLGDQALGCSSSREGDASRIQTFDANNGSAMLDMEGKLIPQWHRDGVVILNSDDKTNTHYSWKGDQVATVDFQTGDPWPKVRSGALTPVASRDRKNIVEMVSPEGKPVLTSTFTKTGEAGNRVFVHSGTGKEIGTPALAQKVMGTGTGKTIAVDYFDEGKLVFYRDDGSEIAQFPYGKEGHAIVDHGILVSTSADGKTTTVYAPQG
ncbi:MAG: PQQ-binding-like beta-propeller repeat protein [Actinomycetaceae bacterium]|nr:PQQ-binding-like beta-propeller repeat protein [Actinomycetaceae bacterium]